MTDPYDLLRRAKATFEEYDLENSNEWLADFDQLPGATLSRHEVRVLRDPALRCLHNKEVVTKLLGLGLLFKVQRMAGNYPNRKFITTIRRNQEGKEALRLRADVTCECLHCTAIQKETP